MNRRGGELLAGAALAYQHHRRRGWRDTRQLVVQDLHPRRAAEDAAEAPQPAQLIAQHADFLLQGRGLLRVPQDCLDALQVRRLDQIIACPRAQRGHRAVDRCMTGHDDHFGGFRFIQLTHQLDAFAIGKPQIRQQNIGLLAPELDACLTQTERARNGKAFHASDFLQPVDDIRVVVDDQSMCHVYPSLPAESATRNPHRTRPTGTFDASGSSGLDLWVERVQMSRRVDLQNHIQHPTPHAWFDGSRMAVSVLAIAVISAGAALDRRRRRARASLARPEINRWEDEGGAIPPEDRTSIVNSTGRRARPSVRG